MGRQFVILALVFFAVVGMVSAAASKVPEHSPSTIPASEGPSSGVIGNTDGSEDAAPVGGPVSDGAFSTLATDSPTGPPTKSAASALQISTIAAATAAAATFFY